jgi:hypothetical protein
MSCGAGCGCLIHVSILQANNPCGTLYKKPHLPAQTGIAARIRLKYNAELGMGGSECLPKRPFHLFGPGATPTDDKCSQSPQHQRSHERLSGQFLAENHGPSTNQAFDGPQRRVHRNRKPILNEHADVSSANGKRDPPGWHESMQPHGFPEAKAGNGPPYPFHARASPECVDRHGQALAAASGQRFQERLDAFARIQLSITDQPERSADLPLKE